MANYKPLPIGVEDFKEIIDKGSFYVDKTLMIKDLIDNHSKVMLFTRPRRFGKTLNISMLQSFFEHTAESNAYLFDGLNIAKTGECYMAHQGQYPVITLSLKSMKQPNFDLSFQLFKDIMMHEFGRHREVLQSNVILSEDKKSFEAILNGTAGDAVYNTSIRLLSDCLSAVHGKKVIILIDEYDVPLETAHFRGFYNEMVDLIRSLFESALKTNPNLEFGVLTGCLRVSRESIFTGLNNLSIYSIINNDFSEYFGFTEAEITNISQTFDLSENLPEMKLWYDGYQFGKTEIYNPWSILKYVQSAISKEACSAQPYWSNTSSNEIIHDLVVRGDEETHKLIESLVHGAKVTKPIYEDITYQNINVNSDYIWSFLLFTGYLKPLRLFKGSDYLTYVDAVIPNIEIQTTYQTTIMQWFNEKVRSNGTEKLFQAVVHGDAETFENEVNEWLLQCISYHDNYENFYHGFLAGLLLGTRGYRVESNREHGSGRSDIIIYEFQKRSVAVVIEIKMASDYGDLDAACNRALQQIEDKHYEAAIKQQYYQKILKYGVAFCSEKVCRVKLC